MKKKVLVIDDEMTMRALLEILLGKQYEVHTVSSAIEALTWLDRNLPDLIISDVQMPDLDGFGFLKTVREKGYTRNTPIIMLSGKLESKERIKCYQLGAQDYLTKPFNLEELEEVIKKNLFPINNSNLWEIHYN